MSPRVPQFAIPFRLSAGSVVENEQGTVPDVKACAEAVLRYTPLGRCVELPDFGTPDQAFQQSGPDPAEIHAALAQWEPRALVDLGPAVLDDLTATVRVSIGGTA